MLIAQISDLHVCAEGVDYAGSVPSHAMAVAAVETVNRLDPPPDVVIVTGDLTDNGALEEYAAVRPILDRLAVPYLVMPGNHDRRETLRAAFADHAYLPATGPLDYCIEDWPVRLVMHDSIVPGDHHGEIGDDALAWLDAVLAADTTRPTIVAMHHHPFTTGMHYIDAYRHRGGDRIAETIGRHSHVARVVCGHVHRGISVGFGGTLAMCCPSTASQLALRLGPGAAPGSYLEPPGGLLHHWLPGGPLVSHQFPIGDFGPPLAVF